ncbi:hypothetical protein [Staphylococcus aureus]|nr:hypothetical protein [Staphylococcus aureus]
MRYSKFSIEDDKSVSKGNYFSDIFKSILLLLVLFTLIGFSF